MLVEMWLVHNERNVCFGECNEFLSIAESASAARIARDARGDWRETWTPFAQDGAGGLFVTDAESGRVSFLGSEGAVAREIASSLREYLEEAGVFAIPTP